METPGSKRQERRRRPEPTIGERSVDALNRVVTKREEDRAATPDDPRLKENHKETPEDESSPS